MNVKVFSISFILAVCLSQIISFEIFADVPPKVHKYNLIPGDPSIQPSICTECHKTYKLGLISYGELGTHKGIGMKHMPEVRNCSFCHSSKQPNQLNLLDGTLISMDVSYKLCKQCHGKTAYDWENGMHGRVTGSWISDRAISNCALCHDAHDPQFKSMASVATPIAPKYVIKKMENEP